MTTRCMVNYRTKQHKNSDFLQEKTKSPLSSLAFSSDSKCAAKSESLLKQLLPFKNFHVLWIRLRSQTRNLAPFKIDRLSLSNFRASRDRPAGLPRRRFRNFITYHYVDFKKITTLTNLSKY